MTLATPTLIKQYLPAHTHIYADLSRAELHILAPVSGDAKFLRALESDFHRWTISMAKGMSPEAVTSDLREKSKRIIYSLIYSAFTPEVAASYAARDLGEPMDEMLDIVFKILDQFPQLVEWVDSEIYSWFDNEGWFTYLCNARKMVPPAAYSQRDLNKLRGTEQARIAINQVAQNSIGLLLKMIFGKMLNDPILGERPQGLIQVFDSIGMICPTDTLDTTVRRLNRLMTTVITVENERTGLTSSTILKADFGVSTQGYKQCQRIPKGLLPDYKLSDIQPLVDDCTLNAKQDRKTSVYRDLSEFGVEAQWVYWKRPDAANPYRADTPLSHVDNPMNPFQNPFADLEDSGFLT